MIRLEKVNVPDNVDKKQLLGDVKNGKMQGCLYNDIVCYGPDPIEKLNDRDIKKIIHDLLPDFPEDYLKDYQIEDLKKSLLLTRVFNINKPGYGKTLETILWIKYHRSLSHKKFQILILCPKSVICSWHYQLNKYWPTYLTDCVWWITNYEQLYNSHNKSIALEIKWDVIVLDESHKIKSMKSKINEYVFELYADASKHCLTGTPVKNRPQDLAAQLKWLDPYSITNFTDFQFAFCDMYRDKWGWKPQGLTKNKQMVENLQLLLQQYCIGGKEHNKDQMEQPEYIKVRLKMDPKVKDLYHKVEGEWSEELGQRVIDTEYLLEQGIKVSSAIESAVRRQQLASNPQLFDDKLINVKFEWIADWLEGTDEKVIIFSKYAQTIEKLEKFLLARKVHLTTIRQNMSAVTRQAAYNQFKKGRQVLLTTFGLTKEGVDGLQECCSYMIFVDREWTASDNEQAEHRIFRLGQKEKCIFYILQCTGTIDIKIEHTQLDKGHDARELLEPVSEDEE